MPSVQPPSPPQPIPAAQPVGQPVAVVVKAPATLHQLPPGSTLKATVEAAPTQSLAANQVQVNTALGPITLQTSFAVPKNIQLTLTLTQLTPLPQFLITEINGKSVSGTQLSQLKSGLTSRSDTASLLPATPLAQGTQLSAVLVRPAITFASLPSTPEGSPKASLQSAATPGSVAPSSPPTPTAATPLASTSTTSAAAPQTTPALPNSNAPGQLATSSSATASPETKAGHTPVTVQSGAAQTLVQLPSGTRLNISIVRIDSPSAALNAPIGQSGNGLNVGSTLSGTIIGTTPQGQPIAQTPHATIALETLSKIAEGARVVFKIESAPTQPTIPDTAKLGRVPLSDTQLQGKTWPNLNEALQVLAQADPARAQHFVQTAIPQPGEKLSSQMLFFLSVLKGGDLKAWLGENTTRILDRERPGLVSRLSGDFQVMSKMADEPQSGDWRLAMVPLFNGNQIEQLRMYYRGGGGHEEENDTEDTRFVLDLDLSNIGHLQIDGLMKPSSKKLDLIVRSEQPLPAEWRKDILTIFTIGQDITGMGGALAFQAAPGNFIEFPAPKDLAANPGLLV